MLTANLKAIIGEYQALVVDLDPLLYLARDKNLQIDMIPRLQAMAERMDAGRLEEAKNKNCEAANILLGLRSLARALIHELKCYIALKDNDPNEAWDRLVDAELGLATAMRAHPSFDYLKAKGAHLRMLEDAFFPPQSFLSAGLIVGRQECSICRGDYAECGHVAMRPYCGEMCYVVLQRCVPDHVALVDDPANRHCRVVAFSVPGGRRNKMSWVVTPNEPNRPAPEVPEGAMIAESTIASIDDFGGEWPQNFFDERLN
jgi:hypothetical protein